MYINISLVSVNAAVSHVLRRLYPVIQWVVDSMVRSDLVVSSKGGYVFFTFQKKKRLSR